MKETCTICEKRPAKRQCPRQDNGMICSLCCVAERGPDCTDCDHYTVAQQYRAGRRGPAALPDGHFIAELNPEVEAAVNRALEFAERGRPDAAWPKVKRLLHEHPLNHTVHFAEGVLHAIQGRHKEAIECFDRALAIFPYFLEAHFNCVHGAWGVAERAGGASRRCRQERSQFPYSWEHGSVLCQAGPWFQRWFGKKHGPANPPLDGQNTLREDDA